MLSLTAGDGQDGSSGGGSDGGGGSGGGMSSNAAVIRQHRVAEIDGAVRFGAHVVGSGPSPSTRLLMHLVGARCGVDPNFVSLMEEDDKDLRVGDLYDK